jgi:GNAT superfamily N-acetyltransferase
MKIDFLAEHREFIPIIAQWSYDEWSYLSPQRTLQDFADRIAQRAHTDKIPLTLIAREGEELIGTICLTLHDMETRKDLSPWLAGLFVAEPWRNQGVGKMLVAAIEKVAENLGIAHLYLYTPDAEDFYLKLGWAVKERIVYRDHPVAIMAKTLS